MSTLTFSSPSARFPVPVADAMAAVAMALVFVAYHAILGFPTLADSGGDNDSVMRLVRVRDLIGGQGWFDQAQYRMGLEGGFVMHWSRLIDLPIALLIKLFGETAALIIWPTVLFAAAMFFLLRAARNIGEDFVALPAAVIGGLALFYVNVFTPGALDHHNVQLTLALGMLVMLLRHEAPLVCGALAGVFAALMLAVGMEASPVVAVACVSVALSFLIGSAPEARRATGFGLGFGGISVLCFAATVPASGWLEAQCDAFSMPQTGLAVLGGFGLAAIAALPIPRGSVVHKVVPLAVLAALAGGLAVTAFPQCLADPFAELDPRLMAYWLGSVTEAQSVFSILRVNPAMFAAHYITPVIALAVMPLLWRRGESREFAVMTALLATALILSLWQVRGTLFSLPFAAVPLAAWVAQARAMVNAKSTGLAQLSMVAAWLVSFNIVWQMATQMIVGQNAGIGDSAEEASSSMSTCTAKADYAALAALPAGTVLAISNLGSPILAHTPHRVLAGPYHRNIEGNLATLDMLMGDPQAVEMQARQLSVDYLAVCPGNSETSAMRGWAPDGLLSALASGQTPAWLERLSDGDGPIRLYRLSAL